MSQHPRPDVSVVLLNYNGGEDTLVALEGLDALVVPDGGVEVVVVDNGSTDGSVPAIEARLAASPHTTVLVRNEENLGFTGGCNTGAAAATGRHLALLNNDARPDPEWLVSALAALDRGPDIGCVASQVRSWSGDAVDFGGGCGVTFYGFGYREGFGSPVEEVADIDQRRDVLFATGSAAVLRREAWDAVGGFDDRFFAFFEDVDLGWRLWLAGWRVVYEPTSVVFHQHHGTMKRFAPWWEEYLLERNALFTLIKNVDETRLPSALSAALLLAAERGRRAGAEPHLLDLAHGAPTPDEPDTVEVSRAGLAPWLALTSVAEELPRLLADRQTIQQQRRRSDAEILGLVAHPLLPNRPDRDYQEAMQLVVETLGVDRAFGTRHRVAIVTGDPLTAAMSGPGIRAWEMARVLSRHHEVRLLTTGRCERTGEGFTCTHASRDVLRDAEAWADVIVFQGFLLDQHPWLVRSTTPMVVDLYDPFHLEQLEQSRGAEPEIRRIHTTSTVRVLNEQLRRGDLFMCASAKQRDFWLGQLAGLGRLNPVTYDDDPTLRRLIDVVPFGVPATPAVKESRVLKGVVDGIGEHDRVVLWGGGLYDWFDPQTVVRAMAQLRASRPDLKLFFLGGRHPNPDVPEMPVAAATRDLAAELGVLDESVVFNEGWVDYAERQEWLLESDIGVSAHLDHVETAFSFRTRILDYIWCGLPVVCTAGDTLGDLVEARGLGLVVPPGDVAAMADALDRLSADEDLRASAGEALAELATTLTWEHALAPLVDFCDRPRRAADLAARWGDVELSVPTSVRPGQRRALELARRANDLARREGVGALARKAAGRLRR